MRLAEFKAWFEGFSEGIEGTPNEVQWNKIKDKIEKLETNELKVPVYRGPVEFPPRYEITS